MYYKLTIKISDKTDSYGKIPEGKEIALRKQDLKLDETVLKMNIVNLSGSFSITIKKYDFIYFSVALANSERLYHQARICLKHWCFIYYDITS